MSACYHSVSHTAEPADLLDEAVRRAVARAIETGEVLNPDAEARQMAASHPGIARTRIADLLIRAGVEARINLELGPRDASDGASRGTTFPHHHGVSGEPRRLAAA